MKKKEYKQPTIKTVRIDSAAIICTSPGDTTETINLGNTTEEENPEPEDDGFIYGD